MGPFTADPVLVSSFGSGDSRVSTSAATMQTLGCSSELFLINQIGRLLQAIEHRR